MPNVLIFVGASVGTSVSVPAAVSYVAIFDYRQPASICLWSWFA